MREGSIHYRGWRVVAACFAMSFVGMGFGFYGHSVYLASLTSKADGAPGISIGTVSTAVTAYYLAAAVIMVFVSDLVARLGPRLFAAIGAIVMGASLYLISHIRTATDLFIAYLAMAPAFAMLTNAAAANIIGPWFDDKRGLAMSFALTGGGMGGLVIVPALTRLSGKLTFPTAVQIVAGVAIPVLLLLIALCIPRPKAEATAVVGPRRSAAMEGYATRRSSLGSPHYWTIALPLMLAIMVQVGFVVHQVSFLSPTLGRDGAGFAVFLTALMAATSRIVVGFFIDRLDQRKVGAVLLAAQASALFAMLDSASPSVAYLASAAFGFAIGVMITLPALMIQQECPPIAFGMLSGLTLAIIQTGNAFGPSIIGWLHDATGNYTSPIMVCIALEIAAIVIISIRIGPAREGAPKPSWQARP